jgi:hypothetical protein
LPKNVFDFPFKMIDGFESIFEKNGATTFSIMTLGLTTFGIMAVMLCRVSFMPHVAHNPFMLSVIMPIVEAPKTTFVFPPKFYPILTKSNGCLKGPIYTSA